MELITVREIAKLVGKTESMIYYMVNVKDLFTKYPTGMPSPIYLLDKDEVLCHFNTREPRKDYSNFLTTTSVTIDGEEYVSIRKAATLLNLSNNRTAYLANKYSIKTTPIVTPKRGSTVHNLICLPEIMEVIEAENRITEIRESLNNKRER
jgi:hypothetical protein